MDGTDVSEQTDLAGPIAETEVAPEPAPAVATATAPAPEPAPAEPAGGVSSSAATENGDVSDVDAASLMEQFLADPSHDYKTLKYGDVMDGIVMHVDREELLVDIGSKSEGIVPAREYSSLTNEEKQALQIGDTILVFVVQPENQEGHAVVSIDRARQEKSWRRLQEIFEANEVIEAEVTNYNKGGLLVNLDGVRGFVPASQVSEIRGGDEASKQADMARMIGTSLPLKVIEINRHRNRLILSERQAVQERRDVMKERLIEELKEGEIRKGRVSSICDFGAFVDIGGADGLVHLSELSWSRVRHPSEVLKVGQEVDVYVLGINAQEKKIALSIKRTQAEPWSRVAAQYEVGQLVRGTVTQLANFGAFARIEDGIEGLIHVSELADERITHPKQVVQEGQELLLRIIRIDPQRRRMGLSLRRALDTPDTELVAVFGEEILEERDRLVQRIRASLEAEGIEPSAIPAPREAATEASGAPEPTAPAAETPTTEPTAEAASAAAPTETAEAASDEAAAETPVASAATTPAESRETRQRGRAAEAVPAVAIPTDVDGEPLSAMAMAFAMAGAAPDALVDETATEPVVGTATSDVPAAQVSAEAPVAEEAPAAEVAPAESAAEAAPIEAAASTTGAMAEEPAATVDDEDTTQAAATEDGTAEASVGETAAAAEDAPADGGVAAIAETVTETVVSAAETVTSAVGSVVGAVASRVAEAIASDDAPEPAAEASEPAATAASDDLAAEANTTENGAEVAATDAPEPDAPATEAPATRGDEEATGADGGGEPER